SRGTRRRLRTASDRSVGIWPGRPRDQRACRFYRRIVRAPAAPRRASCLPCRRLATKATARRDFCRPSPSFPSQLDLLIHPPRSGSGSRDQTRLAQRRRRESAHPTSIFAPHRDLPLSGCVLLDEIVCSINRSYGLLPNNGQSFLRGKQGDADDKLVIL